MIGPGSQFVARIGEALTSGLMLTIDGGQANAGLVYVDNLVDYLVWAAEAENARSEIYNVRDAYDVSWAEFIDVLRGSVKGKGNIVNLPFGFANRLAQSVEGCYRLFSLPGSRFCIAFWFLSLGGPADTMRRRSGSTVDCRVKLGLVKAWNDPSPGSSSVRRNTESVCILKIQTRMPVRHFVFLQGMPSPFISASWPVASRERVPGYADQFLCW